MNERNPYGVTYRKRRHWQHINIEFPTYDAALEWIAKSGVRITYVPDGCLWQIVRGQRVEATIDPADHGPEVRTPYDPLRDLVVHVALDHTPGRTYFQPSCDGCRRRVRGMINVGNALFAADIRTATAEAEAEAVEADANARDDDPRTCHARRT